MHLIKTLPYRTHHFILYCDNYFSNIPLFHALRKIGVAACGTVRPNSAAYPPPFKIDKRKTSLPWGRLIGMVLSEVLVLLWQDKTIVQFLTTAHEATPEPENFELVERRQTQITSTNREIIQQGWQGEPHRLQYCPKASVDYNNHMGGVDIADQCRSYYSTQLIACRNWLPLFTWLIDTAIINSFIIACEVISHPPKSQPY